MQTMPSHPQGLLRTCLQHPRRTQRGMKRTPSSLLLGKSIKINVKYKLFRMCLSVSYSRFAQYFRFFFFLSKKKRPKEVPGSGKSFHGPENNQNQRMSSVEILTKKILEDMQQSEIIVNYLADKYDNEPEKKVLSFLLYTEKLTLTFMTQGSVK